MISLLKETPDKEFLKPADLLKVEVCQKTNTLPCQGCGGHWEDFLPGTEPTTHCDPQAFEKKPAAEIKIDPLLEGLSISFENQERL